jgi:4-methyl-5(b-hydroxyethyl)-thiazole monophosphate biosynthesis
MKRVLLFLPNGFEAYEAAAFTDVLGWASLFGSEEIEVVTAGLHERLKCTFYLEAVPAVQLSEVKVKDFDALAIPGGFSRAGFYEDAYSPQFSEVIRKFHQANKPVAAVCVGALPVAKSGILKGRQATTYHLGERPRQELAEMGANVLDQQIVKDGRIITSTSPATAVDVAFALLEELTSRENMREIKRRMGFTT